MHFKRGLKLWSINIDFYYNEAKKLYDEGLFDFIELSVLKDSLDTLKYWEKVKIPYIIHNAHFAQGFCLSQKEKMSENLEIYKQTKIFADALYAQYIIFHGGIGGEQSETIRQLNILDDSRAIVENKPKIVESDNLKGIDCIGYLPSSIKEIKNSANCGFCLDFVHAICAANALKTNRDDFIDEFLKLNPNMFHITNLKDINSPYDSHEHLYDGDLDVIKYLKKVPKNAFVTFEMKRDSKENLDDFRKDMLWLRENIG